MIEGKKLYEWQEKLVKYEGNTTTKGGRQTGKSWAVAERIKYWAEKVPGSTSLILASSERQENYLLFKVKALMGDLYKYKQRATLSLLHLQNGSKIFKYPIGQTGVYVEGMSSVYFVYIDEAIHVGEKVYDSIIPMLAEPRKRGYGWLNLLSATKGRAKGTFKDSFDLDNYYKTTIKAEDCEHIDKGFLEEEKIRLGARMFGVIYDGDFDEEAHLYYIREIIDRQTTFKFWKHKRNYNRNARYFLGIDPARYGKSKAAFAISEMVGDQIRIIYGEEFQRSSLTQLRDRTKELDGYFKFSKIFIDGGGFGAGLIDILQEIPGFKRRVRDLNNKCASKGENKILKEDLYSNVSRLMETRKLTFIDDEIVIDGLRKVEFNDDEKILGTDMSEAVVRACWAIKEKGLKLFVRSF